MERHKLLSSWDMSAKMAANGIRIRVCTSDAARPLSYKTKTTYIFKTKTVFQDQYRFF